MNFTKGHSNKVNFPSQLGPVPDWHWPNSHSSKNSMIFQNLSKSIQIKILPQLIEKRAIIVSKDDTSESRQRATRAPSSPTLAVQIWAFPASQRLNPLLNKLFFHHHLAQSNKNSPEQDGKVSDFVRYFVHQDGKGGDETELEGGEEAGGNGKPVDEVVDAVGC